MFGAIAGLAGKALGAIGAGKAWDGIKKIGGKVLDKVGLDNVLGAGGAAAGAAADFKAQERQHDFSAKQASINRDFQAKQIAKQMKFQKNMSSTQVQRAAKDMEKAGLNRILALGQPAAAPPGAAASGSQASGASASPGASMASGRQAGIAAATAKENIENLKTQRTLMQAQAYKAAQEGRKESAWADKVETTAIPFTMLQDSFGREGGAAKEMAELLRKIQRATGGNVIELFNDSRDYVNEKWHKIKDIPRLKERR